MPKVTLQEGIKKDSHTISITVSHELYKKISYYAIDKADYGLTQAGDRK